MRESNIQNNILKFPGRYIPFVSSLQNQGVVSSNSSVEVSIVIPVYNKVEYTRNCLKSFYEHHNNSISYEMIVVNNASADGTVEFIQENYKHIKLISNQKNLGFAKACNQGALASQGKYVLFLNNDTYFSDRKWLEEMLLAIKSKEDIGIVGNKQIFPHSETIHHAGIVFNKDKLPLHIYPHLPKDYEKAAVSRYVPAVTGACLLIKKDLFYEIGMFDETYINGYEDIDLCLKADLFSQKTWYCASSCIYHFGFISDGRTAKDNSNARFFLEKWSDRILQNDFTYA